MDLKRVYKNLTNIDIDSQKRLWDECGKGYYGEYLVFCELYKKITGNCKILMNLNIPVKKDKTTEIDLLMIHETGIYIFEIKHFKGTIYGTDTDDNWTQYFRTSKNKVFKNPILQNEYHKKAIKNIFNNVPVKSIIVFTSNDCILKVENANSDVNVCTLESLDLVLLHNLDADKNLYNMEEIEEMFYKLSHYSPMNDLMVFDGETKVFNYWLQPLLNEFQIERDYYVEKNKKVQIKYNRVSKELLELGKRKSNCIMFCIFFAIFSLLMMGSFNSYVKDKYVKEANQCLQSSQSGYYCDEIIDSSINVNISDVSFDYSSKTVLFSAKININDDKYGIEFTSDSKYIVADKNGVAFSYSLFSDEFPYVYSDVIIGKGIKNSFKLPSMKFNVYDDSEIYYIKLNNVKLFLLEDSSIVSTNHSIMLYKKRT